MRDAPAATIIRPMDGRDVRNVVVLLEAAFGATPYLTRASEVFDLASRSDDREHRALVAERGGQLVGAIAFGELLGSDRVARFHVLALASHGERDAGLALLHAMEDAARVSGSRFVFAELADDSPLQRTITLLREAGYTEETHIADYIRDGVSLVYLRRAL